jgi:hypothetical protein
MAVKFAKGDKSFDQEVIYKFLKFLMDLWATDLNDRPQEVERSIEVKFLRNPLIISNLQGQLYTKAGCIIHRIVILSTCKNS